MLQLQMLPEAIQDCSDAIDISNGLLVAHHKRAGLYIACQMYREAVNDYAYLIQNTEKDPQNEFKISCLIADLENAQRLCVAKAVPNHYDILNLDSTATTSDIRNRLKELAKHMHEGI